MDSSSPRAQRRRQEEPVPRLRRTRARFPYVLIDRLIPGVEATYLGVKDEDLGEARNGPSDRPWGGSGSAHPAGPNVFHRRGPPARLPEASEWLRKMPIRSEYIVSGQHGDSNRIRRHAATAE